MDTIERTIIIKAPIEKVWRTVATAEGFQGWFTKGLEGVWAPGQQIVLSWGDANKCEIRIIELLEPTLFIYQWHPGVSGMLTDYPEAELTTVRFELKQVEGGTELRLSETGFETIPDARRLEALGLNSEGWNEEMEHLKTFAEL